MGKSYRVIVECYDKNSPETVLSQCSVLEGDINKPTNCMDFTMGIEKQIALLQNVQDFVILEKAYLLNQDKKYALVVRANWLNLENKHPLFMMF